MSDLLEQPAFLFALLVVLITIIHWLWERNDHA